jgi:hypothetical protein
MAKLQALADEENVSLPQYLAGMLRHSLRGDNLAHVHFFQDGSGDTYNTDDLDEIARQSDAESAAGLTTICKTKEESDEHFRKLREEAAMEAARKKESHKHVSTRVYQTIR